MRLFSGKITPLSEDIVRALAENGDIECESRKEVAKDLEAIFASYLQAEREVNDKAKDVMESRGLPGSELGRLRRIAAEQVGIKIGDDMMDYLLDQLIEMLMHSGNVDEVFAEDHDLRRGMRPVLRKYLDIDEALEVEARGQLKHVKEGTRTWEVEYQRVMGDIKNRRGLG